MQRILAVSLIVLFAFTTARGQEDDARWAGNLEMNGYRLGAYKDFLKDWQLVTVRYRVDSGEYRFTYANPVAWKAMSEGKKEYPDGSIFAKVAYHLSHDPAFPASMVPSQVGRYQLMVKDEKKHAETDGWGYALFDATGRTMAGEPKQVTTACHACHQIVPGLDYVFSKSLSREIQFSGGPTGQLKTADGSVKLPGFETISVADLPAEAKAHLPKSVKKVRSLTGSLKKHYFQGTLDEIRPFLSMEVVAAKMPAILIGEDKKRFSMVFADESAKGTCDSGPRKGVPMISVLTVQKQDANRQLRTYAPVPADAKDVVTQSVCFPI